MESLQIELTVDYPYDLLLLADPSEEFVNNYITHSDCFVAKVDQKVVGVLVIQKQDNCQAEIMNLAVDESWQRKGIARGLLRYISDTWAHVNKIKKLIVCTGTSGAGPFMLYQQEGFDIIELDRDYFVRTYPEPIWENGIQCRHRLILEKYIP